VTLDRGGDGRAAVPGGWRGALLTVRFCTELALLVVLAFAGAGLGDGAATSIVLGVLLPTGAAVTWGALIAPRARRRLADPARLGLELVLFAGAAVAGSLGGHTGLAVVFALVAVAAAVLARLFAPEA
jgi:hypothetical protein